MPRHREGPRTVFAGPPPLHGPRQWVALGLIMALLAVFGGVAAFEFVPPSPGAGRLGAANGNQPGPGPVFPTGSPPTSTASEGDGALVGAGALGPGAPTNSWVTRENAKPGTRAWELTNPATHHEIEGYAGSVSINDGDSVDLYVSTTAPTYTVQAFRMGYYGGEDGRRIWTSPVLTGTKQAAFKLVAGVNTVEDFWSPSLSVQTEAQSWPQGDYLFQLDASNGYQSYVPLTIRDDASTAAYLIDNDVTTWQAYNLYGSYDLYQGPKGYASRSRIVSFDRPYTLGDGSGDFLGNELNVVSLVESLGLDVTYSTDVDLDEQPDLLLSHRAFVSLGHDEYYSMAMRNGLLNALDEGVNLVFLGANAIYRHIRFEPSEDGPDRLEVDYKDARADPLYGHDNADVTPVAWRDPPNDQPESEIIGDYYQCNPVLADMVIADPTSWIFQGTTVVAGSRLTNLVGTEYDHYDPYVASPDDVHILARSPLVCQGRADYADMTYYSAPSRAGVFATGTLNWVPMMDPTACELPCPGPTVVRVTENVLAAFGGGPAGIEAPSVANNSDVPIPKLAPGRKHATPVPSPEVGEGASD